MVPRYTLASVLVAIGPLLYFAAGSNVSGPLYLTPYIDAGNIAAAVEASRVVDPCDVTDPEQDCGTRIPDSYAGFLTVNKTLHNHLFFWYFPSQEQELAPLLICLNGGPGVSSMWGLFWENGPLQPRQPGSSEDVSEKFEARQGSWLGPFSLLYIDNPVYTGYSHSSGVPRATQEEYGDDLCESVLQFYKLFPYLKNADLYIGGQSYAGKYVPVLAQKIHSLRLKNETDIPLRGIYLGSALFAPEQMFPEAFEAMYNLGVISDSQRMKGKSEVQKNVDKYANGEFSSITTFFKIAPTVFGLNLDSYDNYVTGERPNHDQEISPILKSDRIREAVHLGNLDYTAFNRSLYIQLLDDFMLNTTAQLGELLDAGDYKVLIYTGDFDVLISVAMVEAGLFAVPWSGQDEYRNAIRNMWYGPRTSDSERGPLFGYYSQTGQLCRVTVRGAGHQTPHDQPAASKEMMIQFVRYGCVG